MCKKKDAFLASFFFMQRPGGRRGLAAAETAGAAPA